LVRDDASPELYKIRQELQAVRRKINRNFSKELKDYIDKGWLSDTKEGFVNERRVLAVMATHKRKIPGVPMGSSKSGNVIFIEPAANQSLNFEYELLQDDERKEIYRILMALTRVIRKSLPLIEAYQRLLPELDFLQAKTRLALDLNADLPGISDEQEIDLIEAYHPILLLMNKKIGKKTFPQRLRMDKFSRMLVISGPNAGGKSITLKTVGLLQVMLQSGLLVPCSPNSTMSIFHAVLTDIGDNQSIENQLSTYSYRLKRMKHFLEVANRRSLLLLDEFGTGSDPELGGALAEVFFEELYNRKCFGVITTHYGNIKLKASQLRNAINGSMLFDKGSLEPLYRLDIGQPGSSFTFEVAEINGIPKQLIDDAKSRLDANKVQLDNLIADLQKEKADLEKHVKSAREAEQKAEKARQSFESRQAKYEEKLQSQQEVIEKNNQYLAKGRKMQAFIDQYAVKGKATQNKELLEEIRKYVAVEKTKIEEAKRAEELKIKAAAKKQVKKKAKPEQDLIKVGSLVRLTGGKQSGTVIEIDGKTAVVAFGVFKTKAELNKLTFIK
jgi:DNA mismatch repair protein MutS2